MFVLVLVPKTTAQRVPLGDAGGSPIADRLAVKEHPALAANLRGRLQVALLVEVTTAGTVVLGP